jgi:hypothetical protein
MPRIICGTLLLFASMMSAQQQRDPPYVTPPTFPESKNPAQSMPPDTPAPPNQGKAEPSRESAQIAQQIQQAVDNEPLLKDSDLKVKVDDTKVTLTGIVANEKEREIALSAAALYAGKREIVDQIKIRT